MTTKRLIRSLYISWSGDCSRVVWRWRGAGALAGWLSPEVVRADVAVTGHVPVVGVALQEGVQGELDGGDHQVDAEYDSEPLTTNFHEVFRLPPAGGDGGDDGHGEGEMVDDEAGEDVSGRVHC